VIELVPTFFYFEEEVECMCPSRRPHLHFLHEPSYRDNTWLIYRGVEGNWFYAWSEWKRVADPLIARVPEELKSLLGSL
jgi:hypothetical protein